MESAIATPLAFNPALKESSVLSFRLRQAGRLSIVIVDEDGFPVRGLWKDSACPAGTGLQAVWDGKDDQGMTVPNEAFFPVFRLRTATGIDSLHPLLASGGIEFEPKEVHYEEGRFSYLLDAPSRMLARVGFKKGAMLATPVDWKPRVAGRITEHWNGRDADNLQDIAALPGISLMLVGYTLPQPCFLLYGNDSLDYQAYRKARDSSLQKRVMPRALFRDNHRVSPHFFQARMNDGVPRLLISFPDSPGKDGSGAAKLSGKALVRVEIDPRDARFLEEQYEISFFVDNEFYAEEEVGYAPYNWLWNLEGVKPGPHILTVNVASFKDRVGVGSRRVSKAK